MALLLSPDAGAAPDRFVESLVRLQRERSAARMPVRVTWLNHYSIRIALAEAVDSLREMDVCGVDGQFLKWLLRHPVRTSADLVVPLLLRSDDTILTVLAIGGCDDRGTALSEALSDIAGRPVTVICVDGFEGLPRGGDLEELVRSLAPDMLIVGLGAGLQEQVLLEGSRAMTRGYALTCGGFLDQVLQPGYYPAWAYPLRLNWLVRLAREPRRLWRRYTIGALLALCRSHGWRRVMAEVGGLRAHARMCADGLSSVDVAARPGGTSLLASGDPVPTPRAAGLPVSRGDAVA